MEKKMTYVEAIDAIVEGNASAEVLARLADLRASLTKKTVSKAQQDKADARAADKVAVLDALTVVNDWQSIGDMLTKVDSLKGKSAQYVSRLLTDLKDEGKIDRKLEKGKVYFRIAE